MGDPAAKLGTQVEAGEPGVVPEQVGDGVVEVPVEEGEPVGGQGSDRRCHAVDVARLPSAKLRPV